jgi:5-deoxy-glucuronate isomerase
VTALLEVAPSSGSSFDVHLEPKVGGTARLGAARGAGPASGRTNEAVAWVLVEGGDGELRVGATGSMVGGRADVFDGPGWSALVPPGSSFAVEGPLRWTVLWRQSKRSLAPRIVRPDEVAVDERGKGTYARTVRTYLAEGPLIAGETVNPPGGWSSWPPHRHEQEEVYVYRFDPQQGFGVALTYGDATEVARMVHDGHVQRISSGFHPVVAAPGYAMCYAWALAGQSDSLAPVLDPVHAWMA